MDPMKSKEGRKPFQDLTNTINGGGQSNSNSQAQNDERAQRKRERDRARFAAMSKDAKDERNKKRREMYRARKAENQQDNIVSAAETTPTCGTPGAVVESNVENNNGSEDSEWLHRNDTYNPMSIDIDDTCTDQSIVNYLTDDASFDLNTGTLCFSNDEV